MTLYCRISYVLTLVMLCVFSAHGQTTLASNPSDDEAITRKLVEETTQTAATYQRAIRTFYVDASCYPAYTTDTAEMAGFAGSPAGTPSFQNFEIEQLPITSMDGQYPHMGGLTTPIAYLTHLRPDPFSLKSASPFAYFGDCHGYLVWSAGPDGKFDIDWTKYDTKKMPGEAFKLKYTYDPTNGLISSGDIWLGEGGHGSN